MSRKRILLSKPSTTGNEITYLKQALAEDWIVPMGPQVNEFEARLNSLYKSKFTVAMNSGTSAIHIALRLLDISAEDTVLCQSLTFIASASPVIYQNANLHFVDSEEDTWNICPKSLQKSIEELNKRNIKPKALITVDLYGASCKYEEIIEICKKYQIKIIQDSAEALGSTYKGQSLGSQGDYGVLSFNGNKIISSSGGGVLILNTQEEAARSLKLITQAKEDAPYYLHTEIGYNYRMSNICACIGLGQLDFLNEKVSKRKLIFNQYSERLKDLPISFQDSLNKLESNRWLTCITLIKKDPDQLISFLKSKNIEARRIWKPLHTQPVFKDTSFTSINTSPISEKIFNNGVCLPSGDELSSEDIEYVSSSIIEFFQDA